MHDDEVETSVALVAQLLRAQFPQWADLPITPVSSAGTDNALYRLGAELAVRLPRVPWVTGQVAQEQQWLPRLAPFLPLAIPIPLARGEPAAGSPWRWSVYRWLAGENTTFERLADPCQAAMDLAYFITALQRIDATDGPLPGAHNSWRGEPLTERDDLVRNAITTLCALFDEKAMTTVWDAAMTAPAWQHPPVWIHSDLQVGNLLAQQGRLNAVIDFGCLGVGDPACDVMVAWLFLTAETRAIFRTVLQVDDATWARGRGWALAFGLTALPYYQKTNPVLAGIARRAIQEVLADDQARD